MCKKRGRVTYSQSISIIKQRQSKLSINNVFNFRSENISINENEKEGLTTITTITRKYLKKNIVKF